MRKLNEYFFKHFKKIIAWAIAILVFLTCIVLYERHIVLFPTTDDAYIRANTINIATQVGGSVDKIYVENNQFVKKGQLLFSLDPRPYIYAIHKAEANLILAQQKIVSFQDAVDTAAAKLAGTEANYKVARLNAPRIMTLANEGKAAKAEGVTAEGQLANSKAAVAAAQSQLQQAMSNLGKAGDDNAEIMEAKAALQQAQLNLGYTKIYTPANGYLTNFTLRPGQNIVADQNVFALVETDRWWADANYKETNLKRIHAGQKAIIKLDIYGDKKFNGIVESISYASGSTFSLFPAENATGNWVKVTQRFPVKVIIIHPDSHFPLRLGASAIVMIDTSHE